MRFFLRCLFLFKKHFRSTLPIILSIVLTLLAGLLYLSKNLTSIEVLQRLEAIPYDIRLKLSTPQTAINIPPIVIVDIDENSLKKHGRWPWSRKKLSKLIEQIHKNSPAVIALDIVLSEEEINPISVLDKELSNMSRTIPLWLKNLKSEFDADTFFSQTIKDKEVVLGYPFHKHLITRSGKLPKTTFNSDIANIESTTAINMKGYTSNLQKFTDNVAGSGFFSISPDRDGNVRRAAIVAIYNNQVYPSLALEAARIYLFEDKIKLHTEIIGQVNTVTHVSLGKKEIPTDAQGQILIPYIGKQGHFDYISAHDILADEKKFTKLENAIVLIGTSAKGLTDLRPTPLQASFPGVEIQANILHGILNPEIIAYSPDWTEGATIIWLTVSCLIMIFLYPLLQPIQLVLSGLTLLIFSFTLNYWLWVSQHINLPMILSLLLIMAISSVFVIYDLFIESKGRKRIHNMFGQYVPKEHINKLIDNPKQISVDGEKREMSVLFSDLRNFTSLSESLSTKELKSFLNQYLTPITKIIFNHQGTVDKYVGDMVMAFWGAPIEDPAHAQNSVLTALDMQKMISQMQSDFKKLGLENVKAGIGIHTGDMNVGDMGSDYRRAYTVLGDAVNLGARLESLTKYYDVKILVSEQTKLQCSDIVFRYIDHVRVKGKKNSIKIYEPLAIRNELLNPYIEQLNAHEESLNAYLCGDWSKASDLFKHQYQETKQVLYLLYLDRISQYDGVPPKDWDTIFIHKNK